MSANNRKVKQLLDIAKGVKKLDETPPPSFNESIQKQPQNISKYSHKPSKAMGIFKFIFVLVLLLVICIIILLGLVNYINLPLYIVNILYFIAIPLIAGVLTQIILKRFLVNLFLISLFISSLFTILLYCLLQP